MFEVEAKVSIDKSSYYKLRQKLRDEAKYLNRAVSKDDYYTEASLPITIRIRKKLGRQTFDLKKRMTTKGIESNLEKEWLLKRPKYWKKLLQKIGLNVNVSKIKKSENFHYKGFRIELITIEKLGNYLEIEQLVKNKESLPEAKKKLTKIFEELGYSQDQFEPKPYLELLANV